MANTRTLDQRISLFRDQREREWMQQRSIRTWVHETVVLSNDASLERLDDWKVYVFWIRLYGTLYDLRKHWVGVCEKRKARSLDTTRWAELVGAVNQAKAALSEDQLLCLEYRRHWVGHPILNDFRVTESKDEIRDTRKAALLANRPTPKDTYDDVLNRMIRDDNHKDNARDMARVASPALDRLFDLVLQTYPNCSLNEFVDVEAV